MTTRFPASPSSAAATSPVRPPPTMIASAASLTVAEPSSRGVAPFEMRLEIGSVELLAGGALDQLRRRMERRLLPDVLAPPVIDRVEPAGGDVGLDIGHLPLDRCPLLCGHQRAKRVGREI